MKYGFLGCGNMGGAVALALSKKTHDILLTSRSVSSAEALAKKLGCRYAQTNEEVASSCDIVFLAVKPQMMASVLQPLTLQLQKKRPLIVSMAAGLSLKKLDELTSGGLPILRIMPNTPVAIGKGMTTYCANELVSGDILEALLSDLSEAGRFDPIEEKLMDVGSAAAGCSPAYAYMFIEAMADGAVTCGLPRAKAMEYAAAALAGAAEMVLATGKHPGALKDAVCSPGGSTIAGIRVLEDKAFRSAAMECVVAAYSKNKELGK